MMDLVSISIIGLLVVFFVLMVGAFSSCFKQLEQKIEGIYATLQTEKQALQMNLEERFDKAEATIKTILQRVDN